MKVNGACHCGSIAFEATVDPKNVIICHCTDCQTMSGSAFRTVVVSEPDGFTFTRGKAKTYLKTAHSGNVREQTFCPECGSPFYSATAGVTPKVYAIRAGVVEQRDVLEPAKQIWCSSALDWLGHINTYPKAEGQN